MSTKGIHVDISGEFNIGDHPMDIIPIQTVAITVPASKPATVQRKLFRAYTEKPLRTSGMMIPKLKKEK